MAIQSRALVLALFVIGLFVLAPAGARAQFADAAAQDTTAAADGTGQPSLLTAEQLNALVAPVALYPDDLLAIVLPACTNPIQVVEAGKFLEKQKADPSLKPDESWDPSVIALVNYPEVVTKLNEDIGWTQDLGNAVLDQQQDVLNAIQAARESAAQGGYLASNDHVTVVNEGDNISIESPNPDVIYVPQYDPQPIIYNNYTTSYPPPYYSDPYPPYWYPTATFFAGAFVGAAFAYGFDWDNGDIDIDNDINVSRGDTNIGSGNTNIGSGDRNRVEHNRGDKTNRFNGERKAGSDKMKWSSQKARQKSSATRRPTATQRPTSGSIQQGLGQGGSGQFKGQGAGQNQLKNNKAAKNQANRGNQSLQNKNTKQMRQNNTSRQQMQRQQQQRQQPSQRSQVRQKPNKGGAWAGQGNQRVKQNSARGNKSMNRSGGGGGRPPKASRGGGGRR